MSGLPHAQNYCELVVYQKARALQKEIFLLSRVFPRDDQFSLVDQIRRSSRSIGANLAEAWGMRRYEKHFASKLTDADGEQYETQHWIGTAVDCEYLSREKANPYMEKCEEIGRLLGGTMDKADLFCGELPKTLCESATDYFAGSSAIPSPIKN
ncbi:MAG: four helix bundle protein [Chloroflexi bacterium]|nr:four helix bundle protein [Chloroflexota bacterium]